jgi:hypothetical protein
LAAQVEALDSLRLELAGWRAVLVAGASPDAVLWESGRSLAGRLAPVEGVLAGPPPAYPPAGTEAAGLTAWADDALQAVEGGLAGLEAAGANQETRLQELEQAFEDANERSLGLSPNLTIKELLPRQGPDRLRPTSLLVLVGGGLGLLAWAMRLLLGVRARGAA